MISEEDYAWARRVLEEDPPPPLTAQQLRSLDLLGKVEKAKPKKKPARKAS